MHRIRFGALAALALALLAGPPAAARAEDARSEPGEASAPTLDERLKALEAAQAEARKAIDALRADLERSPAGAEKAALGERLTALERLLADLETQVAELRKSVPTSAPAPAAKAPGPVEAPGLTPLSAPLLGSSGSVTSGTAFNPSIAVIPDFTYSRDDRQGDGATILESADGFEAPHGAGEEHAHGGLDEGFSLRETEIAFKGSVDPYFDVVALFAASEEGLSSEEVYVQTRRLPAGFQVKAGKFLSGIGYQNSQHPHQWDFVDAALPYQLLLGGALGEKGVQVTWLPRLPFYLQVGAEALQGENERVASYLGAESAGGEAVLSKKAGPRLFTGFVKLAPDVGYSDALQVGLSYARSTLHQELHDEDGDGAVDVGLEGTVDLYGVDAVWKHDAPDEYGRGDLTLQAEYLYREKRLDVVETAERLRSRQDGAYLQAVYGLLPRLQVAARWDVAGLTNDVDEGDLTESFGASSRLTAALTFDPTEFSRLRVQWDRSDVKVGGGTERVDRLVAMVQVSLGAHGAHRF